MKYELSEPSLADYLRLPRQHRALFRNAVHQLNETYTQAGSAWPPSWPAALRVKPLQGAPGVWEMTWSFAAPDGRATFQFITIDGAPAIRWRRIGGHEVFRNP